MPAAWEKGERLKQTGEKERQISEMPDIESRS
jgi:hypothetical protein